MPALRAIAGDENGYFEVDAWFLSHAHTDHIYELAKILNAYKEGEGSATLTYSGTEYQIPYDTNFYIKNFYFDFPYQEEASTNNWKDVSKSALNDLINGFNIYAETCEIEYEGDRYYDVVNRSVVSQKKIKDGINIEVDGVNIQVLQTWDKEDGNANDNSLILKATVGGQSLLFLNDAGVASGKRLIKTYGGEYLESDVVQLGHHGQNGPNQAFYNAINLSSKTNKTRLWAANSFVWNDDGSSSLLATTDVREWIFGSGEKFTPTDGRDLVACLYPKYPENGGTTVESWTKEILDSMKIDLPYEPSFEEENKDNFIMETGASIRLDEGTTGLRFSATLGYYDDDYIYGFMIVPKDYITSNNITGNYVERLYEIYDPLREGGKLIDLLCKPVSLGSHWKIQGSVSNIKYKNLDMEFTGIAYKHDGEKYSYAEFQSIDDISRSVFNVATKAYNSGLFEGEELEIIEGFIDKTLAKKAGKTQEEFESGERGADTFEFVDDTVSGLFGGEVTLKFDTFYDIDTVEFAFNNEEIEFVSVDNEQKTATFRVIKVGSYNLTATTRGKTISATLTADVKEGYLADFNSSHYAKLFVSDPVYGGRPSNPEVGTFYGKDNVLKIDPSSAGGKICAAMVLPKQPTQTSITVQLLIVGGSGARVGIYGQNNEGWMNPNHSKDYARETWLTLVYTGIDNTGNAKFPYIRFASEAGVEAIYVAGIWDGDQKEAVIQKDLENVKNKLLKTLGDGELANFDSEDYTKLVEVENAGAFTSYKIEYLESYIGKNGVIKFSGTSTKNGIFKVYLPKSMTSTKTGTILQSGKEVADENGNKINFNLTDLLVEMYVVNPGTGAFGMFQNLFKRGDGPYEDPGWGGQNFTPTKNAWFMHGNSKLTADYVRFATGVGEFEFYVSTIYQGTASERLVSTLGENEIANFNSDLYASLFSANSVYNGTINGTTYKKAKVTIGKFMGKENVVELKAQDTTSDSTATFTMPKNPTQTTITLQVYIVGTNDNARFGIHKQEANGWDNTAAGDNHGTASKYARGEWLTILFTEIDNTGKYNQLKFMFQPGIEAVYIAGIWDGDQREFLKNQNA